MSICRKYTASFALMNNAPSSALAADDITALLIVDTVRIAPLLGGNFSSFDKKKCPPARLLDFFSFVIRALYGYDCMAVGFLDPVDPFGRGGKTEQYPRRYLLV